MENSNSLTQRQQQIQGICLPIWLWVNIIWDFSRCSYTWGRTDLPGARNPKGVLWRQNQEASYKQKRRKFKAAVGYLQSNFTSSKQSGGCFEGLGKTSSGHRAVQSQLHKVGTWWRRDKWDFTNKGKHKPSQLSVCLLSWGTVSLACRQQNWGQKTQPKVHTLFELKKRLNVEIYNFTGKVWEEGK